MRLAKRKWRASSIKWKVSTLSVGLLCLLVAVLLSAYLLAPTPQLGLEAKKEVIEKITECLKDGNVEAMKVLLSVKAATTSFKAGSSNKTTTLAEDETISDTNESNTKNEYETVSSTNESTIGVGYETIPSANKSNIGNEKVQVNQFTSRLGGTGHGPGTALQRLVDNFDKVQELAQRGKVYVSTEENGDIVFGTILINSPRGLYILKVKLKKIDGKWVIIE